MRARLPNQVWLRPSFPPKKASGPIAVQVEAARIILSIRSIAAWMNVDVALLRTSETGAGRMQKS